MSDQDAVTPRVIIFRHGETRWAKSGRFTSFTEVELTPTGVAQVSSMAAMFVGVGRLLDPDRLAHVFVSPRKRARRTFELLFPASSNIECDPTYTEDIAEWNYGVYEGLKEQEIRDQRKKNRLDLDREWDIWTDGCEDGESKEQVTQRLDGLIKKIREIQQPFMYGEKPGDVLLVAHGLILRCFTKRWLGLSIDDHLSLTLGTGAMAELSYKGNDVERPTLRLGLALPFGECGC